MIWPMCDTEWDILTELNAGTLKGGLVAHGYVERDFGGITEKGKAAVENRG